MGYTNFIEMRIDFIKEFLHSSRPSSELADFMDAFDIMIPHDLSQTSYRQVAKITHDEVNIKETEHDEPDSKRGKGMNRKIIVMHDGTELFVHPASKIIKVSFGRKTYYFGSIKAASNALCVSAAAVSKAIKLKHRVNGHDVEFVSSKELKELIKND